MAFLELSDVETSKTVRENYGQSQEMNLGVSSKNVQPN